MLTSKQRAFLRAKANTIPALYQIGKNGLDDTVINMVRQALEAKELIKVHVLENALLDAKEACNTLADMIGAEPVQVIGAKFVLYKASRNKKDDEKIKLPK